MYATGSQRLVAGYFVVPMNALLQHRGHVLLSAGHSIAVQNFNENLAILCMLALYTGLVKLSVPVNYTIIAFSFMVIAIVALVMYRHQLNQKQFDSVGLIGQDPTHPV